MAYIHSMDDRVMDNHNFFDMQQSLDPNTMKNLRYSMDDRNPNSKARYNAQNRNYQQDYKDYVKQEIERQKNAGSLRLKNAKVGQWGAVESKIPNDPYSQFRDWNTDNL